MDRHIISSLMEEAIASSQIEGAVTTTKATKFNVARPTARTDPLLLNKLGLLDMKRMGERKIAHTCKEGPKR